MSNIEGNNEGDLENTNPDSSQSNDRLADLVRRGAHARDETDPNEERDGDWSSENPDAVAELPHKQRPVERFRARRGGRPKSRRSLSAQINQVCRLIADVTGRPLGEGGAATYPWHLIDTDDADLYRALIFSRYKNISTRNLMISILREILKECRRSGLISAVRLESLLERLPLRSPGRSTRGRRLTQEHILAVLLACVEDRNRRRGARDSAIVATFLTTGLRASELADLDLADWDPEARTLYARLTKNGQPHTVFVNTGAVSHIEAWLQFRGDWAGPLFSRVKDYKQQGITYAGVAQMLRTRADQAGVPRFGSHDFRRTLATNLLRIYDVSLVSKLLGHRDVASTAIYDLADEDNCREAVESAHVPTLDELRHREAGAGDEPAEAGPSPDSGAGTGDRAGQAA